MPLRDYQLAGLAAKRAALQAGYKRLLRVLPTGGGKGEEIAEIVGSATARGKCCLFLVSRIEIMKDMSRRLERRGIKHGLIQGSNSCKPWLPTQVGSIDTLRRRKVVPPMDILFADEAHFAVSAGWLSVFDKYPNAVILGYTATPCRLTGEGLGRVFQKIIPGPSVAELQERGYLVPARVFAPSEPDLTGVTKSGGDYNQKQLAKACNKPRLVGDVVQHWLKLSRGRPTVAFCVDIDHSKKVRDAFRAAGVRAEHVDAHTSSEDRDRMWDALKSGAVEVVTSVGIISFGWDLPAVSTLILLRPTESLALHLQQCGRGLRPAEGKEYCLILDHAGNTIRHGFVEQPREWSLEDGYVPQKKDDEDSVAVRTCKNCWACFPPTVDVCPECGCAHIPKKRRIETVAGELTEKVMDRWFKCFGCGHRGRLPEGASYDIDCPYCQCGPLRKLGSRYDSGLGNEKQKEDYIRWVLEGRARGYKPGYAYGRFRAIYSGYPRREWTQEAEQRAALQEFAEPVGVGS